MSSETSEQVGGYLKILIERYPMIERRQPILARAGGRRGRYYLTDNFLRAWLAALATPVQALNFVPAARLIEKADDRLAEVEGRSLEKLVALLYEERSRKGVGDFPLTSRIQGSGTAAIPRSTWSPSPRTSDGSVSAHASEARTSSSRTSRSWTAT